MTRSAVVSCSVTRVTQAGWTGSAAATDVKGSATGTASVSTTVRRTIGTALTGCVNRYAEKLNLNCILQTQDVS